MRLAAVALCLVAIVAAVLLIRDDVRRPSVAAVVDAARSPAVDDSRTAMARTVDSLGFPDWRRYSWTPIGGRRDRLEDGREAVTVRYRNGARTVTYTIVSGTDNVDDGDTAVQTQQVSVAGEGKIALVQGVTDGLLTLKRERDGRTIIMTGEPVDQGLVGSLPAAQGGLARTMRRLAVRGIG